MHFKALKFRPKPSKTTSDESIKPTPPSKGPVLPIWKPLHAPGDESTTVNPALPSLRQETLKFDPEYEEWRKPFGDKTRMPPCGTPLEFRTFNDTFMRAVWAALPPQPDIIQTRYTVKSYDGAEIALVRFATAEQMKGGGEIGIASDGQGGGAAQDEGEKTRRPALLYLHGGGLVAVSVAIFAPQLARLAADAGVQVFGAEYRLAPEHPFPAPAEDCYASLQWLSARAPELGIDASRIGVMGDSAGGGLAAATALMARDRALRPPVKSLVLVYPMLDDRVSEVGADSPLLRFATIPLGSIKMCWQAYLGTTESGAAGALSPYAAPARAEDLRGLPRTYIDVGGLDLFRDECATFAGRLAKADVEVEFHLVPGVPHGFESASEIAVTKRAYQGRLRWIGGL
ncbi:hypothetical protein F5Y15DRAFT_415794 [Xylariaceae sp. FL0016]|nr:hypothetical protein F5Y15DRAFT_415794 [Xylariaceae sp. FL0016]